MKLKRNKKRNPLVRQLRNWYQRIVKSKKIYNRKLNNTIKEKI